MFFCCQNTLAYVIDDFESDDVGTLPKKWVSNFGGDAYIKVVSEDENKCLYLYDAQKSSKLAECYFERQEGRMIFEVDVKKPMENSGSCIQLALRTWDDNSAIFIEFRDSSIVHVTQDDGEYILASNVPNGEWINCKFDVDIPAKYFNFYYNDKLYAVDIPFRKKFARDISTIQLTSKSETADQKRSLYIDNVMVSSAKRQVILTLGSNEALINDRGVYIDASPYVVPYLSNDRTMVPLRFVSQAFGTKIYYNADDNSVNCIAGDKNIYHLIGTDTFYIGDKAVKSEAASVIIDGRTMVPIRFFSEALGYNVSYESNQVTITAE